MSYTESGSDIHHIEHSIMSLTKGKPFVFIIESYTRPRKGVFEFVCETIESKFDLVCIRAKEADCSGHDLLAKIHFLIQRAAVIIAEVSDPKPKRPSANVFYEVGYAVGIGKRPLLLMDKKSGTKAPTDVMGMEFIVYDWQSRTGKKDFSRKLVSNLLTRIRSDRPMLMDMLQPQRHEGASSIIVTSPKRVSHRDKIDSTRSDVARPIRTFGDRIGILGLIRAFGSILGESGAVELVSSRHPAEELLRHTGNLYFIGSPKVNPPAGRLLERLQGSSGPKWSFESAQDLASQPSYEEPDTELVLCCNKGGGPVAMRGKKERGATNSEEIWTEDYGLLVRGPNPLNSGRQLVMLMAGAHSLGTGAACLAATRGALIRQVSEMLGKKARKTALANPKSCFWVLVRGRVEGPDYSLREEQVTIEDAGVFD